jgi:hypothetical protein
VAGIPRRGSTAPGTPGDRGGESSETLGERRVSDPGHDGGERRSTANVTDSVGTEASVFLSS